MRKATTAYGLVIHKLFNSILWDFSLGCFGFFGLVFVLAGYKYKYKNKEDGLLHDIVCD